MPPTETFSLIVGLFLAAVVLHYTASLLYVTPSVTLLVGVGALTFIPGLPILKLDLRRKSRCYIEVMVIEGGNEVKPETKAASAMAIGFSKNTPDFKLTNHVFSKDTLDSL